MTSTGTVPAARTGALAGRASRGAVLLVGLAVLAFSALLSLAVGARDIPLGDTLGVLLHGGDGRDASIIQDLRVPRTLLGIAAGAAIGLAGALMQALTRNPLADPGLLGVNAGAALAIVASISYLGATTLTEYVWFGLAGAAVTTFVVYVLGAAGRAGVSPVRLALARGSEARAKWSNPMGTYPAASSASAAARNRFRRGDGPGSSAMGSRR